MQDKFYGYQDNLLKVVEEFETIGDSLFGRISIAKLRVKQPPGQSKPVHCAAYEPRPKEREFVKQLNRPKRNVHPKCVFRQRKMGPIIFAWTIKR